MSSQDPQTPPPVPSSRRVTGALGADAPAAGTPAAGMPVSLILFRIYSGLVALLGLAWAIIGILGVTGVIEPELGLLETVLTEGDEEAQQALLEEDMRDHIGMAIAGPIIFAVYLFGSLIPRRNWTLPVINALLGISLIACITLVPGILLLVFINQKPVREYFAVT